MGSPSSSFDADSLWTPLSVGQILGRTWCLFMENVALHLSLAAVVVVPIVLILVVSLFSISWSMEAQHITWKDFNATHARPLLLVLLVLTIVYIVVGTAVQAALIRVVTERYAGTREPREQQGLATNYLVQGLGKVKSIFLFQFLLHVGMLSVAIVYELTVGFIFIVLGFMLNLDLYTVIIFIGYLVRLSAWMASIYVMVSMFAAIPSIVIEGHGLFRAMERSWDLATTRRMFVFGAYCLYALVVWLPLLVLLFFMVLVTALILPPTTASGMVWSLFWILLFLALCSMVLIPFGAIFQAVLYLNVRIEKEGCRQSVLVRELSAGGSGSGSGRDTTTRPTVMMLGMDHDNTAALYTPIILPDSSPSSACDDENDNNKALLDPKNNNGGSGDDSDAALIV